MRGQPPIGRQALNCRAGRHGDRGEAAPPALTAVRLAAARRMRSAGIMEASMAADRAREMRCEHQQASADTMRP
mgnify:CR=1 FL=1